MRTGQQAAEGIFMRREDQRIFLHCREQARDGMAHEASGDAPYLSRLLAPSAGPIVAASDYVRAVPESVRAYLPEGRRYRTLGTDGFGRSDTRAALRRFFAVDAGSIAQAALQALAG